jgi:hypothetical protein
MLMIGESRIGAALRAPCSRVSWARAKAPAWRAPRNNP